MSSSVFEDQGITFKVISPDMYEDVMDFLWTHLFPSEPISRSLGLKRLGFLDKYVFPDAFRQNLSMVALDRSDNILAVRVGHIKTRDDWTAWMMEPPTPDLVSSWPKALRPSTSHLVTPSSYRIFMGTSWWWSRLASTASLTLWPM